MHDLGYTPAVQERFWAKVDVGDCWEWVAYRSPTGYGKLSYTANGKRRGMLAHRAAYEMLVGPIPHGLELDHVCRNRACVNPDHLEPVPVAVNRRRGAATKLRPHEVAAIQASDLPSAVLAERYRVAQNRISRIRGAAAVEPVVAGKKRRFAPRRSQGGGPILFPVDGEVLCRLRVERGMTQRQLAVLAEVDQSSVSHAESGKHRPKLERVTRIAAALGVALDALIEHEAAREAQATAQTPPGRDGLRTLGPEQARA